MKRGSFLVACRGFIPGKLCLLVCVSMNQVCCSILIHPTQLVKYGVISVQDLVDDLMQWKWLYVSGRLHKPVSNMLILHVSSRRKEASSLLSANHRMRLLQSL